MVGAPGITYKPEPKSGFGVGLGMGLGAGVGAGVGSGFGCGFGGTPFHVFADTEWVVPFVVTVMSPD
ncbi:hypothetical protein [Sporosarcina sp. Marseille-Q4943]|uniref:hypothetical protein n=1 Tax=Sporosarcina sp. Marseille-Q4943 TaxID=2942204 RepID=UPI00208DCB32|nr:hypothetical protein [Sporosarcina sp. Marseille-Q4943]